jgi:glutamate--cysteine ligase
MTAQTVRQPRLSPDPVRDAVDPFRAAHDHVAATALRDSGPGGVGLELELHLVDLTRPAVRPDWATVCQVVAALPAMPAGSRVTVEPGGQLELSTPVAPDVVAAIAALRADVAVLRSALAGTGRGVVALGTDPLRRPRRLHPGPRYSAMERHFAARGQARAGRAMMCSTAALQVNLDAGPARGWAERTALVHALTPVLVAASATSSHLAGRSSGWHSMRDQVWRGIDRRRSGPVAVGDPANAWARHALDAPLMLVRHGTDLVPVTGGVRLREWLADPGRIGRPATREDVDYHLTTLFPPVRPRGYLELRMLDALPDRWWPGLVGLVVTLLDDPVAADAAREVAEPVTDLADRAARSGLRDPGLAAAARDLAAIAVQHAPEGLRADVEALAVLLDDGRTPGDELRRRIDTHGPLRVLEEEAHA